MMTLLGNTVWTGLTHLEGMRINTDLNLPPVARKPYPLTLKHHKFVKEEITTGWIDLKITSLYASPIIVVPKKVNQEHP